MRCEQPWGCAQQAAAARLAKAATRGGPKGPPCSASSSTMASSDGQGRVQEQVGGAEASLQSAAGWGCAGRGLWLAAALARVWDGAPLPGSVQSLLEPWQTRGTGDALREVVSHPSHVACEELAPASRRAASLIRCPLVPAPAETMKGSQPSPARRTDHGLRHCPSAGCSI